MSPGVSRPKAKKAKLVDDRQPEAGLSSTRKLINTPVAVAKDKDVEESADEDADEEPRTPNPIFTDEDEHLIISTLARAECMDTARSKAWRYLHVRVSEGERAV